MRTLIVTPIEEEFVALDGAMRQYGYTATSIEIGCLSGLSYADDGLVVAQGDLGKAQFGIKTQHMIDYLEHVDLIICAGTAGGLDGGLSIGDVVVGTETVEHDFKWGMTSRPQPRFDGSAHHIDELRSGLPSHPFPFRVHFGPMASGDEGIADSTRAADLHDTTGAVAVAWEGAGGARAAQFSGVPFLEVRGISDGAGESAVDEFWENIPDVMRNVAVVVLTLARIS